MVSPTEVPRGGLETPSAAELQARYEAYRVRHARALLRLLPREAIRPLYRQAVGGVGESAASVDDPMVRLLEHCESLLPLPPYEVWLEDFTRNPAAHLEDLEEAADAPSAAAPDTLEARTFDFEQTTWLARLRGFRDQDAWRGFIRFESRDSSAVYRTALIFREDGAAQLRERFLTFESVTLSAFLRSALP